MNKNLLLVLLVFLISVLAFNDFVLAGTFPTSLNNYQDGDIIESDAWNQLEYKIGVDNSASNTSLDYLVRHLTPERFVYSNATTDEQCLTYESTGNTFQWQTCGSGGVTGTSTAGLAISGTNIGLDLGTSTAGIVIASNNLLGLSANIMGFNSATTSLFNANYTWYNASSSNIPVYSTSLNRFLGNLAFGSTTGLAATSSSFETSILGLIASTSQGVRYTDASTTKYEAGYVGRVIGTSTAGITFVGNQIGLSPSLVSISSSTVTKANLLVGNGSVWTILPVGTDNLCLVATSSTQTGLGWSTCGSGGSGVTGTTTAGLVISGTNIGLNLGTSTAGIVITSNNLLGLSPNIMAFDSATTTKFNAAYTWYNASNSAIAVNTSNIVNASTTKWDIAEGWYTASSSKIIIYSSATTSAFNAAYTWYNASNSAIAVKTSNIVNASTTKWDTAQGLVNASSTKWDIAYGYWTASSSNLMTWSSATTSLFNANYVWYNASNSNIAVKTSNIVNASTTNWDTAYGKVNASSTNWDLAHGWYAASSSAIANKSSTLTGIWAGTDLTPENLGYNNATSDEFCLTYETTNNTFSWQTCGTGGGGGGGWSTSTLDDALYPIDENYDVWIGSTASATAPFWFDVSSSTLTMGTGGAGDSVISLYASGTHAWTIGTDYDDNQKFKISTSTDFSSGVVLSFSTGTGAAVFSGSITGSNITVASTSAWNNATGWYMASSSSIIVGTSNIVNASTTKWDITQGIVNASSTKWDISYASSTAFQPKFDLVAASSTKWDIAYGSWIASSTNLMTWTSATTSLFNANYNWYNASNSNIAVKTSNIVNASTTAWDIVQGAWTASSSNLMTWSSATTSNFNANYVWYNASSSVIANKTSTMTGIWNGTIITAAKGGTGLDTSGWTGLIKITGGTWGTTTASSTLSITILNASSSVSGNANFKKQVAMTIAKVSCNGNNGSTTFQLYEATQANPNTARTALMTAPLLCGGDSIASTTSFADNSVAALAPVVASTTLTTGAGTNFTIYVDYFYQ